MEDKNDEEMLISAGGGSSSPVLGSSRWNPTKEQINLLEGLYRQGMRTPSAEQIQEITSRLKAYGNIEGKNVFYWFQNHKARQRQRQRQKLENMAHFNHFLHHNKPSSSPAVLAPLIPSPAPACTNVGGGSPFYIQYSNGGVGHYPQYYSSKVLLPSTTTTTGTINKQQRIRRPTAASLGGSGASLMVHEKLQHHQLMNMSNNNNSTTDHQALLPLFPLHPTGILDNQKLENSSFVSASSSTTEDSNIRSSSSSSESGVDHCINPGNQSFIDFFANHQEFSRSD